MLSVSIVKNTLYQIIGKGITAGIGLFITIIVAKYFGVDGYGGFTQVITYVALFYLFLDFGLNAIFLQKDEQGQHFKDLLYSRLLFAGCIFIFANLLAFLLPYNPAVKIGFSESVRLGIFVFSFTLFSQAVILSASAIFQKKLRYDLLLQASVVGSLFTFILVFMATVFTLPLPFLLGAFVVGGFISAQLTLTHTGEQLFPLNIDKVFLKDLVKTSLPLGIMLVFNLIYFRADILILSLLKPASDVGIYGLSYRIFEFLITLPLFLSNSLYPTLLTEQKFANYSHKTLIYALLFFLLGIITLATAWFFAPLVSFIKPEFEASVLPLRILLFALPIFFVTNILQWVLITHKQQRFLALVYGVVTVINIIGNIIFIPTYSYIASAVITGVLEGVVLVVLTIRIFMVGEKYAN